MEVVTLGLAFAVDAVLLGNPSYSGGLGFLVKTPSFFGASLDIIASPARYATITLVLLVLAGLVVSNLRAGRAGRRLIAVRTNERAAMALGVSGRGGQDPRLHRRRHDRRQVGGVLIGFDPLLTGSGDQFGGLQSVNLMQAAVFGGVGHISGSLIASSLQAGTLGQQIISSFSSKPALYLSLGSGLALLVMLPIAPDGLASLLRRRDRLRSRPRAVGPEPPQPARTTIAGRVLQVRDLSVRYGGTVALEGFSVDVGPGEIVGLIGPNGSGKTTAIDAITGFVAPVAGSVSLDEDRIVRWSPERRARHGLIRSFQSLELFDDLTVMENMQTAGDRRDFWAYISNLFHRDRSRVTPQARAALQDFGLHQQLHIRCRHLSYADRRLLAVARAVAAGGSVLLLDEPASGLGEADARSLSRALSRLARESGVGVLLVEHNVDMVMRTCHRVVVLNFGHVIAAGRPSEVRADPEVITAYLGAPRTVRGSTEGAREG